MEDVKNEIVEKAAIQAADVATKSAQEAVETVKKSLEGTMETFQKEAKSDREIMQKAIDQMKEQRNAAFGIGKKRNEFQEKLASAKDSYFSKGKAVIEMDMKTFTAGAGPAGQIYGDERVADIKYDPNFTNRMRTMLMTGSAGTNGAIRYNQETTDTPNAGSKAKGAQQAVAVKTVTDRQVPIQTLSIFHTLPEEWLEDTAMLESYFSTRFMGDLMDAEDLNILRGDPGTGAAGSLTAATAFEGVNNNGLVLANAAAIQGVVGTLANDFSATATANLYDVLTAAKAALANDNFMADLCILNPIDEARLALIRDGERRYQLNQTTSPDGSGIQQFWGGMRVMSTPAQVAGTFTVLDSKKSTQYWVREGLNIQFDRNANDFQGNNISIRGIIRGNVTNYLPNGIISDTFANWQTALDA